MGDGQHAWAAAEWLMMVRNCFVFEEEYEDKLVVAAGISPSWCGESGRVEFGPAPTRFGPVSVSLESRKDEIALTWSGAWHAAPPAIEVRFPEEGLETTGREDGKRFYRRKMKDA
jgi:hypothetical protein